MKRVLLTGATGFVGRWCVAALVAAGYEVHAVSVKSAGREVPGVVWHCADLFDAGQVDRLLYTVRPSHLLHLAWIVTPGAYWTSLDNFRWVQASLHLIQAFTAGGGQRAVVVGTCAEYDGKADVCIEQEMPLKPASVYGVCKNALQEMLHAFGNQVGLSTAWPRLFYLYGPHEPPARLIPTVVHTLLQGEPMACSNGEQMRDFIYVEDAASALIALLNSTVNGPVNIASGMPIALKDVLLLVGEYLGQADLIRLGALPTRPGEPFRLVADVTRLTQEVGWTPQYTLEQGIKRTVDWWRNELNDHTDSERVAYE
jgi:nucleoside-diphosphate-sugar epimerase